MPIRMPILVIAGGSVYTLPLQSKNMTVRRGRAEGKGRGFFVK